jgi:hypothetical protein
MPAGAPLDPVVAAAEAAAQACLPVGERPPSIVAEVRAFSYERATWREVTLEEARWATREILALAEIIGRTETWVIARSGPPLYVSGRWLAIDTPWPFYEAHDRQERWPTLAALLEACGLAEEARAVDGLVGHPRCACVGDTLRQTARKIARLRRLVRSACELGVETPEFPYTKLYRSRWRLDHEPNPEGVPDEAFRHASMAEAFTTMGLDHLAGAARRAFAAVRAPARP